MNFRIITNGRYYRVQRRHWSGVWLNEMRINEGGGQGPWQWTTFKEAQAYINQKILDSHPSVWTVVTKEPAHE